MEENVVSMSGQTTPDVKEKKEEKFDINKVPREELVAAITQLNQNLRMAGQRIEYLEGQLSSIDFREMRLQDCFKVLENRNALNDPDFIITICDEVKNLMTIKKPAEENKEAEK